MGWMDYDVQLWTELRDAARDAVGKKLAHPIIGSDERRDAIEHSRIERPSRRRRPSDPVRRAKPARLRAAGRPAGDVHLQPALRRTARRGKGPAQLVPDARRGVSAVARMEHVGVHRQPAVGGDGRSAAVGGSAVFQRQDSVPVDSIPISPGQ